MKITESDYEFDDYYIRTSEVEPVLRDGELITYNSDNRKHGNKWCKVTNLVLYNDDSLTSVLCSWICRHGGSQFWRHYRNENRVNWKQLDDGERMLILDAYHNKAPNWANVPGKLKREYLKPKELQRLEIDEQGTIYGYKYLLLDEKGFLHSPLRLKSVWENGEIEADHEPTQDNTHGIYAMKSRKSPVLGKYAHENCVLVRLALSGTVVEANEGLRAQHAIVAEVL